MAAQPSAPPPAPEPSYKVLSSDGIEFRVTPLALAHSETLSTMIAAFGYTPENLESQEAIPLQEIDSTTFSVVLKWAEHHKGEPIPENTDGVPKDLVIAEFDRELLSVDNDLLFDVTCAANYLNVRGLLDVCCKIIADMSIGRSPEELRIIYGIPTDEEDEAMAAAERAAAEKKAAEEAAARETADRAAAAERAAAEEAACKEAAERAAASERTVAADAVRVEGEAAAQVEEAAVEAERAVDAEARAEEEAAPNEEAFAERDATVGEAAPVERAAAEGVSAVQEVRDEGEAAAPVEEAAPAKGAVVQEDRARGEAAPVVDAALVEQAARDQAANR